MSSVDVDVRDERARPDERGRPDEHARPGTAPDLASEDAAPNTTELTTPSTAHHGLEQTVLPSPTTIALQPSPRELHQTRLAHVQPLVSELYQANSRLGPWEHDALPAPEDETAVRRWLLESRRTHAREVVDRTRAEPPVRDLDALPEPLARLLAVVASEGDDAGFLFPADLHVLLEDRIWLLPPGERELVAERRLGARRRSALRAAVAAQHREAIGTADAVLAFTTVPWRLQVLHGERGYRRALMESGISVSRVCGLAAAAGLQPVAIVDFVETTVDDCLFNDGVERFCTALVSLRLPSGAPEDAPEEDDA